MSAPKFVLFSAVAIFGTIGVLSVVQKKNAKQAESVPQQENAALESVASPGDEEEATLTHLEEPVDEAPGDVDKIRELFTTGPNKLPIVETIRYTSRVPWLKGRPAWIADYASYYNTSRHFIARSLNGRADYLTQKVTSGNKFNVFRKDKNVHFHLVVDISRSKMFFFYHDLDTNERVHMKTYPVGLGRKDGNYPSGCLTPLGKYLLGEKVASYKSGVQGYFQDEPVEMIQVFGTRWIPFKEEVGAKCTEDARGFGLHGAPWFQRAEDGELVEDRGSVGLFDSDGCIRLYKEDIEELYAIVVSKPTYIEIVRSFSEAELPGVEAEGNL